MKLLLDDCVWGRARHELELAGHDAIWVGDWEEDPGDDQILEVALAQGRILVTLDKDFGELAIVRGRPHAGIIRLVGFSARQQAGACLQVLERYNAELGAGGLVTAVPGRVRVRPATDEPT